jgi:hypothetical protein
MVHLTWLIHPKFYNIDKRPKIQKFKIYFSPFFFFEQGSPIGLLLHACACIMIMNHEYHLQISHILCLVETKAHVLRSI